MKRTTLILEDACFDGIKELAHRQKTTMSEVVNRLLADGIRRSGARKPAPFELPAFPMGRPRVPLADREALEAAMERG